MLNNCTSIERSGESFSALNPSHQSELKSLPTRILGNRCYGDGSHDPCRKRCRPCAVCPKDSPEQRTGKIIRHKRMYIYVGRVLKHIIQVQRDDAERARTQSR